MDSYHSYHIHPTSEGVLVAYSYSGIDDRTSANIAEIIQTACRACESRCPGCKGNAELRIEDGLLTRRCEACKSAPTFPPSRFASASGQFNTISVVR